MLSCWHTGTITAVINGLHWAVGTASLLHALLCADKVFYHFCLYGVGSQVKCTSRTAVILLLHVPRALHLPALLLGCLVLAGLLPAMSGTQYESPGSSLRARTLGTAARHSLSAHEPSLHLLRNAPQRRRCSVLSESAQKRRQQGAAACAKPLLRRAGTAASTGSHLCCWLHISALPLW